MKLSTSASPPRIFRLAVTCVKVGVDDKPDYLATIDVDPNSKTHGEVIHRLPMPYAGDELHHFGWNACSSCHADHDHMRRYIVLPGLKSRRIHICAAADPRAPQPIERLKTDGRHVISAPGNVGIAGEAERMIHNAIDRLGMTDHGPVHFHIVANIALRLARILEKRQVLMSVTRNYDLATHYAELIILLASLFHDLGMSISRDGHEEYSLFLANSILHRILDLTLEHECDHDAGTALLGRRPQLVDPGYGIYNFFYRFYFFYFLLFFFLYRLFFCYRFYFFFFYDGFSCRFFVLFKAYFFILFFLLCFSL